MTVLGCIPARAAGEFGVNPTIPTPWWTGATEDAVPEGDDRVDAGQAEERLGGGRVVSDRRVLDECRLPREEGGRAEHRQRDEDDRDVPEHPPEPLRPREAVDQLAAPKGLPHEERTRGRGRRCEAVLFEEPSLLEPIEQQGPEDNRGPRDKERLQKGHARLQPNLLVYFNLSRRQLTRPDVVRQGVVHRERIDVRLGPLGL